jgi:hypothetical protein
VEDVFLDVKYPPGRSSSKYANTHGNTLTGMFARLGLHDTYRAFAGKEGRMYTRQEKGVETRIDRFFSRAFSSDVVFYDVGLNAPFCRSQAWYSDHFAVTAEIGYIGDSKAEAARKRARINIEVLNDPMVRHLVRSCIKSTWGAYRAVAD